MNDKLLNEKLNELKEAALKNGDYKFAAQAETLQLKDEVGILLDNITRPSLRDYLSISDFESANKIIKTTISVIKEILDKHEVIVLKSQKELVAEELKKLIERI